MLVDVVDVLACPHCGGELAAGAHSLRCERGHVFDVARQGYVSLLQGRGATTASDTSRMVTARAEFLAAGHFDPIRELLAEHAARAVATEQEAGGHVLDAGAGTGDYLATVLERLPGFAGIALDASKYACRRAGKAHPGIGAVVADAWRGLPLREASLPLVLNVFAPRNAAEMQRVLRPGGTLLVVTPTSGHLAELVEPLGLVNVDAGKQQRLDRQLSGFEPVESAPCEFTMSLNHDEVEALAAMGPSAWHTEPESLRQRVAGLPDPATVTASVTLASYRTSTG